MTKKRIDTIRVALPKEMVKVIDYIIKKKPCYGINSRPVFLKHVIREHIRELLERKLLSPEEVNSFFK
jgi:metal-responsive CopG/Arc/MetJ family transcriptional regulator